MQIDPLTIEAPYQDREAKSVEDSLRVRAENIIQLSSTVQALVDVLTLAVDHGAALHDKDTLRILDRSLPEYLGLLSNATTALSDAICTLREDAIPITDQDTNEADR